MFDAVDGPRVFALPPGTNFPAELAKGLLSRLAGLPPVEMARVEIYLNTSRMLRQVRAELERAEIGLLPRLRLITDIGRDVLPGLAPAVPPLRRKLELAMLVSALARQEGDILSGTSVYALADSLAGLLAEMQDEGVLPDRLARPDIAGEHARHWDRSLRFVNLVGPRFTDLGEPDAEARLRRMVEAKIAGWNRAPPDSPVIVAASTGSRGTTALLLDAAARLPRGAVVLPGFDFDMPQAAWASLTTGPMPQEDHPQYRFARLLDRWGITAARVETWTSAPAPNPPRNRLVSLALRPAPLTDQWMDEGGRLTDVAAATCDITLIEAPTPRAEALSLAIALREAAETGIRAALVTPDRVLGRRVTALLEQWEITPDDSAGEPLSQTAPGRLLRQVSTLFGQECSAASLLALLKHPLAATGANRRGDHLRLTRDLELSLRRYGPAFPASADLRDWGKRDGRDDWAAWVADLIDGLEATGERSLADWTNLLVGKAAALAAGPGGQVEKSGLWRERAGDQARAMIDGLVREAEHGGLFSPAGFSDLLFTLLSAEARRDPISAHPLVAIWGTLEARVQGADLVLLGGLNEGVWPEAPPPDPWLSRQMRLAAGLLLPERKIGLSAHDFQQAIAARKVILSRARRDAETETVPSRWLARLINLLDGLPGGEGRAVLSGMRGRGRRYLDLGRAIEDVLPVAPASRPAPRPPLEARPRRLPVTAIRQLILDPYDTYARYVLRLRALDPLAAEPDPLLRGTALHKVLEVFIKNIDATETTDMRRVRLLRTADEVLAREVPWVASRRMWRTRLARVADWFLAGEARREAQGRPVNVELTGMVALDGKDFALTARPDRIDERHDGRLHILDYKTGSVPSGKDQKTFQHQLLLEAGIARRGGFADLGPRDVAAISYISLGMNPEEDEKTPDIAHLDEVWAALNRLIAQYERAETGYVARLYDFKPASTSDYDGISRFGEWALHDPPLPEDVS